MHLKFSNRVNEAHFRPGFAVCALKRKEIKDEENVSSLFENLSFPFLFLHCILCCCWWTSVLFGCADVYVFSWGVPIVRRDCKGSNIQKHGETIFPNFRHCLASVAAHLGSRHSYMFHLCSCLAVRCYNGSNFLHDRVSFIWNGQFCVMWTVMLNSGFYRHHKNKFFNPTWKLKMIVAVVGTKYKSNELLHVHLPIHCNTDWYRRCFLPTAIRFLQWFWEVACIAIYRQQNFGFVCNVSEVSLKLLSESYVRQGILNA